LDRKKEKGKERERGTCIRAEEDEPGVAREAHQKAIKKLRVASAVGGEAHQTWIKVQKKRATRTRD